MGCTISKLCIRNLQISDLNLDPNLDSHPNPNPDSGPNPGPNRNSNPKPHPSHIVQRILQIAQTHKLRAT